MKDEILTEKQKLIGAKTICEGHANSWNEHFSRLNGNKEKCLIEISRRTHERTIGNIKLLWEMLEERRRNANKDFIVSKIVLNVPGVWENDFPNLSKIAKSENGNTVFYDEVGSEEGLRKIVHYLSIGATNKINLLMC